MCLVRLWFCALKMEVRGSSEPFVSVNYPTRHPTPQSVAQDLHLCTPVIPVAPVERPVHSTTDCSCVPTDMHVHHQHCESTAVALIVNKCAFWPHCVFVCSVWLQWPALTRTVFSVRWQLNCYVICKSVFVLSTRHGPVCGGGGMKMEPTHPLFMILKHVCLFPQ